MSFLDAIFDPVFGPLMNLPPFFTILIITIVITLLITIVYKYTTNQSEMKRIKDDLKKYQKEMRETKDTKKLMEIQKLSLNLNMKYMGSSFKSTLYTFIPIIIIFSWLSGHIAYHPLTPNTEFIVTAAFGEGAAGNVSISSIPDITIDSATKEITDNAVVWNLKGAAGDYKLTVNYNTESYSKNILITDKKKYAVPDMPIKDSKLKMIKIGNLPVRPFGDNFQLFGWHPGWFATYIILSLGLSTLFRKLMKVY